MKRFLFIAISLIMFFSAGLYAAETFESSDIGYENTFISVSGLVAGVFFFTETIKKLVPQMNGIATQVVSWAVGFVIAFIGWYFNLGIFNGLTWYIALTYGFLTSLVANGFADTGLVYWIIGLFQKG